MSAHTDTAMAAGGRHPARVTLRAMEPEDLDTLYAIENDRGIWNVGVTNVPYSRYALRNYIAGTASDIYADRQVRLMVDDSRGTTVGIADIANFSPDHRRAEVGIVIMDRHRRQGLATAALRQLAAYARATLHLHQLYAVVPQGNEASARLFARLGFTVTATLRHWLFDGTRYHDALVMQLLLESAGE